MWANISHCVFMVDAIGIMLYSGGQGGGPELVVIPCHTIAIAKRVYTYLAANAFKMGNPSNVIPVTRLDVPFPNNIKYNNIQ